MTSIARARRRFHASRHAFAAAVLARDDEATVDASHRLLRAHDRVLAITQHPSRRDVRTLRRWRRFALQALRSEPPTAGLIDRVLAVLANNLGNHHDQ